MQTILGAGGVIASELIKTLPRYSDQVRLVSRSPGTTGHGQEAIKADLTEYEEVSRAVKGSAVTYLTAGLVYSIKVWRESWPTIMQNTINACQEHQSKLVFFDNVYMYDRDHLHHMTEDTPTNPSSKKGLVRTQVAQMLMEAAEKGKIEALIARSADFYGPGTQGRSALTEMVLKNLSKGKPANWLCSTDFVHSFTYTPDAGRATALLGNTPSAFNQVWHLPTAPQPMNGREWIEVIAAEMGTKPRIQMATRFIVKMMGLFNSQMAELYEMLYQYDRDYVFDSSKFDRFFDLQTTGYEEGIKATIESDFKRD